MISKTKIQSSLITLNNLFEKFRYRRPNNSGMLVLWFSKLSILELCGWIEESIDLIILTEAKRRLNTLEKIKIETMVAKNSSFTYEKHFRKMLESSLGAVNVDNLENNLDVATFLKMKASLSTLKSNRDKLAHTFVKGVTTIIDAPSATIDHFKYVYTGLKEIEKHIRKI